MRVWRGVSQPRSLAIITGYRRAATTHAGEAASDQFVKLIGRCQEFSGAACALWPGVCRGRWYPGERCAGRDFSAGAAGAGAGKSSHHPDTPEHIWRRTGIFAVILSWFAPGLAP